MIQKRLLDPILCQNIFYDFFHKCSHTMAPTAFQSSQDALLNIFTNHIHLNINLRTDLLLAQGDFLLSVPDEHHSKRSLAVVYGCQSERGTVDRNVSFGYEVWE